MSAIIHRPRSFPHSPFGILGERDPIGCEPQPGVLVRLAHGLGRLLLAHVGLSAEIVGIGLGHGAEIMRKRGFRSRQASNLAGCAKAALATAATDQGRDSHAAALVRKRLMLARISGKQNELGNGSAIRMPQK